MKAKKILYALIGIAVILLGIAICGTIYDWETEIVCWSLVGGVACSVTILTWVAIRDNDRTPKE